MNRTITKAEYLKKCITSLKGIDKKNWYIASFTIPLWKSNEITKSDEELDLVIQPDGLHTLMEVDGKLELFKISDHKKDEPLFSWQDTISIDNSWLPNVTGKIDTVLGRLLINAIVFVKVCGDRIPYLNKPKFSVNDLESAIISRTANKENMKSGNISVREMVGCIDNLNFFVFVSTFTSIAATPKTITMPPGAAEYRDKLIKEYGDKINDPVMLVELEDKLAAFDADYLKDDPAAAAIFGKKSRASRAKTHYFFGKGLDFVSDKDGRSIIKQSLGEGLETKPEEFAKHFNDLRYASFSRGGNTALAGYTYKILQRSLSGLTISDKPCNTTKGLKRIVMPKQVTKLIGRSIKVGGKWKPLMNEDEVKSLVGKEVEVRSSMYCTSPKNSVCYACMNEFYKGQENAVTNIVAGVSAVILNAFLKLMHGTVTVSTDIEINDLVG